MADTAAHLIDHVLPRTPYRQWVFTLPKPLRLRLARDPTWARWAGQLVVRAIGAWQRRDARARGLRAAHTGAVVFCQRFGGLVNLNVLVVPDGVFVDDGEGLRFVMHPVPTSADVLAILAKSRLNVLGARPRDGRWLRSRDTFSERKPVSRPFDHQRWFMLLSSSWIVLRPTHARNGEPTRARSLFSERFFQLAASSEEIFDVGVSAHVAIATTKRSFQFRLPSGEVGLIRVAAHVTTGFHSRAATHGVESEVVNRGHGCILGEPSQTAAQMPA